MSKSVKFQNEEERYNHNPIITRCGKYMNYWLSKLMKVLFLGEHCPNVNLSAKLYCFFKK